MPLVRNSLFVIGMAICLLHVWLPPFFLTGDGPSHLYNASIIRDKWANHDLEFYRNFYVFKDSPIPNWTSHILLASFLFLVNAALAEKILLTLCILLLTGSLYSLLCRLSPTTYWPLVSILFSFHFTLAMGFFNYLFSMSFCFFAVQSWLRYLEYRRVRAAAFFFLLTLLTYFSHPFGFVLEYLLCFALGVSYAWAGQARKERQRFIFNISLLTLLFTPCILLFLRFAGTYGGHAFHLAFDKEKLPDLFRFNVMVDK